MEFMLARAGFEEIEVTVEDKWHLVARAVRRKEVADEFVPLFSKKKAA
jgi:hypothetical protein